ncbi:MAG: carbamoyltransferase HypF [Pseudomonadota bacterium]
MDQKSSRKALTRRIKATVQGIVQGVGFRPFVYQLAGRFNLTGYISNTSHGLDIEVEGESKEIDSFFSSILSEAPPPAKITSLERLEYPWVGYTGFAIRESKVLASRSTLIAPDISICKECLAELMDAADRRYGYPFINCTNCGPRYTIIEDIPYDRPKTSMKTFPICRQCETEYHDPLNRRFHAQPNACWSCGPRMTLYDEKRSPVLCDDPVSGAAGFLHGGKIVALKGLGGFHLAVDAALDEAVIRLRRRKRREEKPLALMSPDIETIRRYAHLSASEEAALTSPERPIVLLRKKRNTPVSREVAPGHKYFGVMLPYTPLHHLLLRQGFPALVMTSGNLSEEPIAIENEEAFRRLQGIADFWLVHNRDIYMRCDDSVTRVVAGKTSLIRRARGYVPVPVILREKLPEVLACGGELKNTVCLTKGKNAFLSQHIGDLENLETLESFTHIIDHLKRILEIEPGIIAYDLHPDYLSTKYALAQLDNAAGRHGPVQSCGVQHHHAHIVSCMAENQLDEPVIGLAMDGAGYGTDGAVWGGEILIAERKSFVRAGHFDYVSLPGGAAAIKEPWRMAVSYLYKAFGPDFLSLDIPFIKNHAPRTLSLMAEIIGKGINTPRTSSCGRLFDGIAAILELRDRVAYEGQAAMELEMSVSGSKQPGYGHELEKKDGVWIIRVEPMIRQVVDDVRRGIERGRIADRFHQTLVVLFTDLCSRLRGELNTDKVVMSGGVFQNATLLSRLIRSLRRNRFRVYTHRLVPANDGGLSLGQAIVAHARSKMTR